MSCDKKAKPAPVEPWVPVAGLPLPGHGAPEPELALEVADWVPPFEAFTSKRLIEIAYQFHPRVEPAADQTPQEFEYLFDNALERIAMRNAQYLAWERIETWRGLVAAVREQAPPGCQVGDLTIPGHDAAYFATFALPKTEGGTKLSSLTVHLSFLVPFYTYYEERSSLVEYATLERWKIDAVDTDISPELQPLLVIVEREIARRYGYRPFDVSISDIALPNLFIEGADVETRPTLMDALFSAYKPNPSADVRANEPLVPDYGAP
ncbi:hypothetical protein [Haliangium sp.]|uniref:hypothetical protein n=1 Tax=Haliangium sp. TaxID=2663208 RepID=UPI003D0C4A40